MRGEKLGLWIGILIAASAIASGCSYYHEHFPSFAEELRMRRVCITNAHIPPAKADFCMTDSNGHRRDFNACLGAQGVPDFRINELDACVEAKTPPPAAY